MPLVDNLNPNGLSQDTIRRLRTLAIATEGPVEKYDNMPSLTLYNITSCYALKKAKTVL